MADFLRRIAPAVLVGTAAVAVAASAAGSNGTESTVNASAATGSTDTVPDSQNGGTNPESDPRASVEDWLRQLEGDEDDDDHGRGESDDDDDDEDEDSASGSQGAPTVPTPQPGSNSGSSAGGAGSGSTGGSTGSSACDTAEIVGPVVRTEWGPVQVAAKVANGKVCAIRSIQTPDGDRKSVMINARAVPTLEQQVLTAGNANIDGVSGATVTTVGYRTSLQAILDGA